MWRKDVHGRPLQLRLRSGGESLEGKTVGKSFGKTLYSDTEPWLTVMSKLVVVQGF